MDITTNDFVYRQFHLFALPVRLKRFGAIKRPTTSFFAGTSISTIDHPPVCLKSSDLHKVGKLKATIGCLSFCSSPTGNEAPIARREKHQSRDALTPELGLDEVIPSSSSFITDGRARRPLQNLLDYSLPIHLYSLISTVDQPLIKWEVDLDLRRKEETTAERNFLCTTSRDEAPVAYDERYRFGLLTPLQKLLKEAIQPSLRFITKGRPGYFTL